MSKYLNTHRYINSEVMICTWHHKQCTQSEEHRHQWKDTNNHCKYKTLREVIDVTLDTPRSHPVIVHENTLGRAGCRPIRTIHIYVQQTFSDDVPDIKYKYSFLEDQARMRQQTRIAIKNGRKCIGSLTGLTTYKKALGSSKRDS